MGQTASEAAVMQTAAAKFEQVDQELQQMLSQLMNRLDALQGAWVGAGMNSFTQVREAYAQNQRTLSRALQETAGAIRTAGQQYTASDDASRSQMGAVNTSLNLPL